MPDQPAPASLAAALVALQAALPRITKGETAQVPTKSGGSYSYQYANLASIHDVVLPLLASVGLCWICKPTLSDGQLVLAYYLIHAASNEEVTGEYPLGTGTPQQLGSAITYARRYCLTAVLGIAPAEDDDDGAQGTDWKPPAQPHSRKAERHRSDRQGPLPDDDWTDAAPDETPGSITEGRLKELGYWYTKAGITDADDRMAYAMSKLDRPELANSRELSEADGIKLVAALKEDTR